ncbi:MAG: CvpA family protein [Lachnospiraceae bacterium]|nr:CvpA family protein [Lachnospiraceae bacterium]
MIPDTNAVRMLIMILGVLVIILFMKNGYKKGAMRELRSLLSVLVAVICIFLILLLRTSVKEQTYSTAIVIGGAIVILSFGWKLTRMILDLLSGIRELPLIGFADKLLGAVFGAAECIGVIWIVYKLYSLTS